MRTIITIFFFLAQVSVCFSQTWIDIDLKQTEYVYATGKTCLKKTGQPLNGDYAIKFNPYQTNYERFIDGLKNGESKVFRNKKLAEKGLYQNNLKEKEWFYFNEDGSIRERKVFENGLQEGTEISYYNGQVVKTSNYSKNHLNGWVSNFAYTAPYELCKKVFYESDRKINVIQYKKIDSLSFVISDSLFYNDKGKLILKKSFVNDTLLLQFKISYNIIINDPYQMKTTKIEIYDGNKLNIAYLFPEHDKHDTEMRIRELLNYEFVYYTDVNKPELLVSELTRYNINTTTFYRIYPADNLQSVIYDEGEDDILPGWYYRDVK